MLNDRIIMYCKFSVHALEAFDVLDLTSLTPRGAFMCSCLKSHKPRGGQTHKFFAGEELCVKILVS